MKDSSEHQLYSCFQQKVWNDFFVEKKDKDEIIIEYLTDKMQIQFLEDHPEKYSKDMLQYAINTITNSLVSVSVQKIQTLLKQCKSLNEVTVKNIPQFSNFASATIYVPELLNEKKEALSYKELGYLIYADCRSDEAANKYGENHGKLAVLLDLAKVKTKDGKNAFERTLMAEYFSQLNSQEKIDLITRLCYRIPMIQHAVVNKTPYQEIDEQLKRVLAHSTYLRRRPNALEILAFALEE